MLEELGNCDVGRTRELLDYEVLVTSFLISTVQYFCNILYVLGSTSFTVTPFLTVNHMPFESTIRRQKSDLTQSLY